MFLGWHSFGEDGWGLEVFFPLSGVTEKVGILESDCVGSNGDPAAHELGDFRQVI